MEFTNTLATLFIITCFFAGLIMMAYAIKGFAQLFWDEQTIKNRLKKLGE